MSGKTRSSTEDAKQHNTKASPGKLIVSLLAGLVGVQSDKNRISDFSSGSIWPFIIGGVLLTILFIFSLIGLVVLLAP
jgi:hypothetical protein